MTEPASTHCCACCAKEDELTKRAQAIEAACAMLAEGNVAGPTTREAAGEYLTAVFERAKNAETALKMPAL